MLNDLNSLDLDFNGCERPLSILRVASLTNQEFDHLEIIIRKIYKEKIIIRILRFVKAMWRLQVSNKIVTAESYRRCSSFSHCVLARWFGREYENNAAEIRPAFVSKILALTIVSNMLNEKVYVAKVKPYPKRSFFGVNSPLCIRNTIYEQDDTYSFVLAKLIQSHFACIKGNVTFAPYYSDIVNIILPLPSKLT